MAVALSKPEDLLADLIPGQGDAFGAPPSLPMPAAPPPAPRAAVARPAPAPPPDPANDVYAQRLAQLDAARRGSPGAKPEAIKVAHAAQIQSDYAAAKAQAQAGLSAGNAQIQKFSDVVNTVADPVRRGAQAIGLPDWLTNTILPDKNSGRQIEALGGGGAGPLIGMATGGIAAGANAIKNLGRAPQDQVDSGAVYRGYRDVADTNRKQVTGDYPGTALVGAIGGVKAATPALAAGGELLGGLPGVEAAMDAIKGWGPMAAAAKQAKAIKLAGQLALKPGAMDWLANAGQTALSAIPGAAAYSGLEGHTLGEHAANAAKGAAWGAGAGGLIGLGYPLVEGAGNVAKDAYSTVKSMLTKEPEEGLITPADVEAAKQKVADLARQAGVQSGNIAAKAAPFTAPVAGQMLGVQGQNLTGSLARRAGTTGDAMRDLQWLRAQGRPEELKAATSNILGVDPDEARTMYEGIVQKGQDEVRPLYDAIGDDPFGVNSPALDRLLTSKTGKGVLGHVTERAKLQGLSPEGLTWAETEKPPPPGAPQAADPNEAPPVGNRIIQPGDQPPELPPAEQVPVPRAAAVKPSQGMPLHTWLARQGGVGGDAIPEAMVRDIQNIGRRSKQNAKMVDTLAEMAQGQGYFPNHAGAEAPTASEFLDAVMNSHGGKPLYPQYRTLAGGEGPSPAMQRWQAADDAKARNWGMEGRRASEQVDSDEAFKAKQAQDIAEQSAWRQHMDEVGDDYGALEPPGGAAPAAGYPGQAAPQFEPTPTTGLTPKSLVLLHQLSKPNYDAMTGQLLQDDKNLQRSDFHTALGRILLGHPETGEGALLPQYKAPLAAAQRYKATQGAYKGGRGLLMNGTDEAFADYVKGMTLKDKTLDPDKLRGAQLRFGQDIYELAYKGALRGQKFSAPGIEDKLSQIFSPDQAKQMVSKMSAAAEQAAAESRMAPFSNSSSAAMLQAGAETDQGIHPALDAAGVAAKHGMMGLVGDLAKKAWAYRLSQGTSVGYRNALGQLMQMKPAEFEAFLKEMESRPPPAPKPSLAKPVGQAIGGAVGSIVAPRY